MLRCGKDERRSHPLSVCGVCREDWDEDNMRDNVWVTVGFLLKNTADEDLPFVRTMLTHCLGMLTSSLAKPVCPFPS